MLHSRILKITELSDILSFFSYVGHVNKEYAYSSTAFLVLFNAICNLNDNLLTVNNKLYI